MSSKYAKRLDRSRDYGTYHPPDDGAHYNQDGYDFDHDGELVEHRLTAEQQERLKKKGPAAPPKPPAPAPSHGKAHHAKETVHDPEPDADGLNLEAWLRGQEDYPFPDVQKAVKARYSVWKTAKRDLLLFLVEDQKLVETDALSDEFAGIVA
jgi:hypothetical protein